MDEQQIMQLYLELSQGVKNGQDFIRDINDIILFSNFVLLYISCVFSNIGQWLFRLCKVTAL